MIGDHLNLYNRNSSNSAGPIMVNIRYKDFFKNIRQGFVNIKLLSTISLIIDCEIITCSKIYRLSEDK